MRLFLLLFFPVFLTAQPVKKLYKDKLEPGSKLVSCDIMHTFEKLKRGGYVYKGYYPDTRQIIKFKTFEDRGKNKLHGPYAEYWDDGTVLHQGVYVLGKKEGIWTENAVNMGSYLDGKKEGTWFFKRNNGTNYIEKNYSGGLEHGRSVQYDVDGKITLEEFFEHGKLISTTRDTLNHIVTSMPRYPGCENEDKSEAEKNACAEKTLLTALYSKIRYPHSARERGIYGQALVQFVVKKSGEIQDIQVINGVCDAIKKEVLYILNSMPVWKPGHQDGKPVNVSYTLPIQFRLE